MNHAGATGEPVPCHAKDSWLVLDLDGDGTQSLLHKTHGHVGQKQIAGISPSVPDGVVEDPYPRDPNDDELDTYWPKLTKYVWAQKTLGETYYDAFTWRPGEGVIEQPTTLPYEQFMRWQSRAGNSTRRYSTHQSVAIEIGQTPEDVDGELDLDEWRGRITDWADPNNGMVGHGPSEMRLGDVNGDGLADVIMVDQQSCYALQKGASEGDSPIPLSEGCSFRSVLEWGRDLMEQTYEKLAVFVYLNRGDGSFELGGSTRLWDTDLEPDTALDDVLEFFYWGVALDPNLDLDASEIDQLHREAWTIATAATRGWRMEFGNSLIGDANGDGLADLGYIKANFKPDGGWVIGPGGDSMSGTYELEPVWRLARHGGGLSEVDTPMGLNLKTLVPEAEPTGWPGWQENLVNEPTHWLDPGDSAAEVGPYEQQAYGLAARLMQLDVDQDGRAELAFYDHVRGQYKLATPKALSEPQPHLLTAVTDGLGARTELDYAPQWTLTTPSTPWTQDDIDLPYPLYRRRSAAAAVTRLRNDTGQDDGAAPLYTTTQYLYGKSTTDVRRGIGLGVERSYSKQSVATPSGVVNRVRLARYDVTANYDETFKAYPLAGGLLSETVMVFGGPGEAVRLSHGGQRSSAHAGKVGPTWYRRLDSRTASTFEVGGDVPANAAGDLFECLVAAYDGAAECVLGPEASYQPLSASQTYIGYDADGYGLVKNEIVEAAGSTTVTERTYAHVDPAEVLGERYLLGLPQIEWAAHEPKPGVGYTVRTVAHEYYESGLPKQTTVEPDQAQYRHAESYTYDAFGNVETHTVSADGHPANVTTYAYSASGVYPVSVSNALGHTTTTQWYEGCGLPERVTNPLGHTQVNATDAFCRARGSQLFYGEVPLTRQTAVSFEEWEPNGNEGYPDREVLVTTEVEDGAKSYTIANRVGQTLVSQGPGFGFEVYTQTRYDPLGRVLAVSLPTKVGEQPQGWTISTYDGQGRVIAVTKPDGTQQTTQYDRLLTTATNEIGDSGASEVNALGQVVKVMPPADPDLPGVDLSMCYAYGAFGTLVEAKPCTPTANKGPTTLKYDDYGRLIESEDAQAGVRITRYDALGRVDENEDALGQIVKTKYDVLGRVIERIEAYGTPQAKSATWAYDEVAPGLLTVAVNADGTVIETPLLDEYQRPAGGVTTIHGRSYTQRVSYDAWGRVASQSYPSLSLLAPVVTWNQYNALDQLIGLGFQDQTVWQPVTADVWGHLTEQRYGGEAMPTVIATASYDALTGRLDEAKVAQRTWHNADLYSDTLLEHFRYDWYDHGLIHRRIQPSLTDENQEQADQFRYSPRGELKGWTTIGANQAVQHRTIATDGFGNITESPNGEHSYFKEKLLLVKGPQGSIGYTYTGNGQVLTRTHAGGETELGYDALNRVDRIKTADSNQRITYNADGAKVHVKDEASGRETFYLGAYQEERGGALGGSIVGRYALGPLHLTRTWQPDLSYADQRSYTPPADHLGSTTLVTSEKGEALDRRAYDPWGNEREPQDWNAFKAAPQDDVQTPVTGYTGHHERKQFGASAAGISGLIDMHTRYYDPAAMQFLQPDSIVPDVYQPLSWNRRTYVNNSPTNFSDPTGMAAQAANDPGLSESPAQTAERKAAELDDASNQWMGTPYNGGGLGSAPTGLQAGELMMGMRARKTGGAQTAKAAKPLSEKTPEEMSDEEKFWVQAYGRDAANYKLAGMEAPFETVEEYMVWRTISRQAQAMGMNSEMMENMAMRAELAADIMGFGAANPMKPGAMSTSSFKSWMANLLRFGRVSPEVAAAAKQVARRREAMMLDLALANQQGQLWFGLGEEANRRVLRMYGDEIGKVFDWGPIRGMIVGLDTKYATVANAKAAWHVMQRDLGKRSTKLTLDFSFHGDYTAASKFKNEIEKNLREFTPEHMNNFRETGTVSVGIHTYGSSPDYPTGSHHVYIELELAPYE
jgi:RHS repeat-associated protein